MFALFSVLAGMAVSAVCAICYGLIFRPWRESSAQAELKQVYGLLALTALSGAAVGTAFGGTVGMNNLWSLLGAVPALLLGVRDVLRCRADIRDPLPAK